MLAGFQVGCKSLFVSGKRTPHQPKTKMKTTTKKSDAIAANICRQYNEHFDITVEQFSDSIGGKGTEIVIRHKHGYQKGRMAGLVCIASRASFVTGRKSTSVRYVAYNGITGKKVSKENFCWHLRAEKY
jgi:hypothetical protein